jgi:uroporphyrinogen decarboxylase
MASRLSSRERMLATINHQEPDYVPLWFNWYYKDTQILKWDDIVDRAERVLAMGLDDTIRIDVPESVHPETSTRVWVEHPADSRYPLIHKEYYTPKGAMHQIVKQTDDYDDPEYWQKKGGLDVVGLANNYGVPRTVEWPVKGIEDLEKLAYFYQPPTAEQLATYRETVRRAKDLDRRVGVLLEGGWIDVGDFMYTLLGFENLIEAQVDHPELIEALLEMLIPRAHRRIDMLLDAGVDIITHDAWYEIPDVWGVKGFRRFVAPYLREEIAATHQAGAKFSYIQTSGVGPRLDDLLDLNIDILWGADPIQDRTANFPVWKCQAGDKICFLGGLNAHATLINGSEDDIRREVRYARETLGPGGGLILSPIDNIYPYTPRRNLEILIDEWRRVRDYE